MIETLVFPLFHLLNVKHVELTAASLTHYTWLFLDFKIFHKSF